MSRIGAVAVGPEMVRLVVGETIGRGDWRIVDDSARRSNLAEGFLRSGRLDDKAVARTAGALVQIRRKAQILGAGRLAAAAGGFVREVGNPELFRVAAQAALGFEVEFPSTQREAELILRGVGGRIGRAPSLVVGVGTVETSLILASGGRVERAEVLPIGSAGLSAAAREQDLLRCFVRLIRLLPDGFDRDAVRGRRTVIRGPFAVAIASALLGGKRYDPENVEGFAFPRGALENVVANLRATTAEDRRRIRGLPPSRAEDVTSGGHLLLQILEELGIESAVVSARGMRHGLLAELAGSR